MSGKLTIFMAEDDALIRDSLSIAIRNTPDMELVGTADNGQDALRQIMLHKPDLVLIDIQMPVMNGITCIQQLRAHQYEGIIIVLTTFNDEAYIVEALASGATGYLLKGMDFRKLLQALRDAANGEYFLPAEVATKLVQYIARKDPSLKRMALHTFAESHYLSAKEQELLPMLLNRLTNKEIAERMFVTEGTIKNYLTVLYDKLGVRNRREAVQYLERQFQ